MGMKEESTIRFGEGTRKRKEGPARRLCSRAARWWVLPVAVALCAMGRSHAQTTYDLTVLNAFGPGEYYGATPQDSDIWLLTNFQFDYWNGSDWVTGNGSGGNYGTAISLSQIVGGKMRLYNSGGSRMYAVLSPGGVPPTQSSLSTAPNSYFEWSFTGGVPGTFDLSWIDSWDFATQMQIVTPGTSVTYGVKSGVSSATISSNLSSYLTGQHAANYAWLGTSGGFSQTLSYPGTTSTPVRWITNNSAVGPAIQSDTITSFTNALDAVATQAAASPTWEAGTPATGPNWTSAGFRVASISDVTSPDGSTGGNMWSAYVNFSNSGGEFRMTLTDFTVYGGTGIGAAYEQLWNANGATYSLTQSDGLLDAIWTSSANNLVTTPSWVSNLGGNGQNNLFYALYNAIASGVIHHPDFVNNTALPSWTGYVPWVAGQDQYNFEIFVNGAAVAGGRAGYLTGTDAVELMQGYAENGTLVNPYFLELLAAMEQTPAYLYPSQDLWAATSMGSDPFIGLQPGPLNGTEAFEDATFLWSIGGVNAVPEPSTTILLGLGATAFAAWSWRRRQG